MINKVFNRSLIDDYIKLSKGYSYSIKFQEGIYYTNLNSILFQFPSEELIKIEEGKVIYTSSLFANTFYPFYYDSSKMKIGEKLY